MLFSGDLIFHGLTPLVLMGSLEGARRALDWIAAMEPCHVIPGHGPLVGVDRLNGVLDDHDRYYRMVVTTASSGRRDGLTPLEAAQRCDLTEFAGWPDSERLVLNLHRAYADAERRELDLLGALVDAVTFNGGPMRTHVCGL